MQITPVSPRSPNRLCTQPTRSPPPITAHAGDCGRDSVYTERAQRPGPQPCLKDDTGPRESPRNRPRRPRPTSAGRSGRSGRKLCSLKGLGSNETSPIIPKVESLKANSARVSAQKNLLVLLIGSTCWIYFLVNRFAHPLEPVHPRGRTGSPTLREPVLPPSVSRNCMWVNPFAHFASSSSSCSPNSKSLSLTLKVLLVCWLPSPCHFWTSYEIKCFSRKNRNANRTADFE